MNHFPIIKSHFLTFLLASAVILVLPIFVFADTNHSDISAWNQDVQWVYSTSTPFVGDGSEAYVVINGGTHWLKGIYSVTQVAAGFATQDGAQNMLHLDRPPTLYSSLTGTVGIGYTTNSLPSIDPSADLKKIVFVGNSLTASSYPAKMIILLDDPSYSLINFAQAGQTLNSVTAPTQVDPLYDASLRNTLVAWEITNDLVSGTSATDAYNHFVSYTQARKAAGWRVIILSVLPRSDGVPGDWEPRRQTVNAQLRSDFGVPTSNSRLFLPSPGTSYADMLVDVAANPLIGDAGDETGPYYDGSHVHLADGGYALIANDVKDAYLFLLNSIPPQISNVASSTSETTALITWNTDVSASSSISYGTTISYGAVATSTNSTSTHSVSLSGLTPGTQYNFRVLAIDAHGNISTSSNRTFTTVAASDSGGFGTMFVNPSAPEINEAWWADYARRNGLSTSSAALTPSATSTPPVTIASTTCQTPDLFDTRTGARCISATNATKTIFTKSLFFSLIDPEVRLLQQLLNDKGFTVSTIGPGSSGKETTYFGSATRSALARFQSANRITPSVGYFGPVTRTFVNNSI